MANSNYDLELRCVATYFTEDMEKEVSVEFTFDPYNDCTDMDGLKQMAVLSLEEDEGLEDVDSDIVELSIADFGDVPSGYANEKSVWEFAEAFAETDGDYDIEVIEAALQCDVNPSDIDEAYAGEHSSDEDFARELADELGSYDKNAGWPHSCIDWEYAASEIMNDYSEHNGHYFRSM